MDNTLARELAPHAPELDDLRDRDRPVVAMMRELLGVVPNGYPLLDIWPTGLRTFNLLVPNLLNLPGALMGQGAPKDLVGLAMYASSQAAGCPYCIAHHCSWAIRRGADRGTVLGDRNGREQAVADLAAAMAEVPSRVTPDHVRAVEAHLTPRELEWVVLAVALGGFLNKFMDAMGIELEEDSLTDVQALLRGTGWHPGKHLWSAEEPIGIAEEPAGIAEIYETYGAPLSSVDLGWTRVDTSDAIPVDSVGTYLRLMRQTPGAVRRDRSWTRGVSGRIGPTLLTLEDEVGYAFPVLGTLHSTRAVRALATALRDNLDPATSRLGLENKLLAGLVYAGHVDSPLLAQECTLLTDLLVDRPHPWLMGAVRRLASTPTDEAEVPPGLPATQSAVLLLAKSAASSPAAVSEFTVEAIRPHLSPEQIVELLVWLSLLQAMHRLYAFEAARAQASEEAERAVAVV